MLTQTVNPRLWLAVMKPCKVSAAASGEVSLNQRHHMPKKRQIQTVSRPHYGTTALRNDLDSCQPQQVRDAKDAKQCKTEVTINFYGSVVD